jgi:hydroxyacylglutathione hydrolase
VSALTGWNTPVGICIVEVMNGQTWNGQHWRVLAIDTESLGNRSYVVITRDGAVAIDPPRDIDRVESVLAEHGVDLDLVVETHRHADYVSGGLVLSREHGVRYLVPAGEPEPRFRFLAAAPGELVTGAGLELRPVHTPGHTPHHMSYVLQAEGRDVAVFTGGSMLYGAVGRTDLVSADLTVPLAHDQWHSVRGLGLDLAPDVEVMPTHGFGSFCSATPTTGDAKSSTIGQEREVNPALTEDEDTFVATMLAGYDTFPSYYARTPEANAAGPAPVDLGDTPRLSAEQVAAALGEEGTWVIDVREQDEFIGAHLAGSTSFSIGVGLGVYFPWVAPSDARIVLLAPSEDAVVEARRDLARVGYDEVTGAFVGSIGELASVGELTSFVPHRFADLAARVDRNAEDGPADIVDLRRIGEWEEDHLALATHIPLHTLDVAAPSVPAGAWVHCASGMRSVIGASILEARGIDVELVRDDYPAAARTSLERIVGE